MDDLPSKSATGQESHPKAEKTLIPKPLCILDLPLDILKSILAEVGFPAPHLSGPNIN